MNPAEQVGNELFDTPVATDQAPVTDAPQTDTVQASDATKEAVKAEMYKLWDGEYEKSDIEKWKEAHLNQSKWQKDLTQKAQEVANVRKFGEWFDNPQVDFEEKFNFIMKYAPQEKVQQMIQKLAASYGIKNQELPQDKQDPYAPKFQKFEQEIGSLKDYIKNQERKQMQETFHTQFEAAKAKHKDLWTDRHGNIIEKIYIADGGDISKIADEYFKDFGETVEKSKTAYIDKKLKDKSNVVAQPKGGAIPVASSDKPLTEEERKKVFADVAFGDE
jgi:hypothetical protein